MEIGTTVQGLMFARFRRRGYSGRAVLLAAFIICAMVFGGGGTLSPSTEIILQVLFVATAVAWLWIDKPIARGAQQQTDGSFEQKRMRAQRPMGGAAAAQN